MRDHRGDKRQFTIGSKSYYHSSTQKRIWAEDATVEEITFGLYAPNDCGTSGEMTMRWNDFGFDRKPNVIPRLEVFKDGFSALLKFAPMLKRLAEYDTDLNDGPALTPEEFVKVLKEFGFKDATKYESPYATATTF